VPAAPAGSTEPSVTFAPGKTFPFGKSKTLLDLAISKRVRINYECKVGDCGKCRVTVISGAENLEPRTPQENTALRHIGHEEPESRLACVVTKVKGPVVVEAPK
jgi:ferredoxin